MSRYARHPNQSNRITRQYLTTTSGISNIVDDLFFEQQGLTTQITGLSNSNQFGSTSFFQSTQYSVVGHSNSNTFGGISNVKTINVPIVGLAEISQFGIPTTNKALSMNVVGINNNQNIGSVNVSLNINSPINGISNANSFGSLVDLKSLSYNINGISNSSAYGAMSSNTNYKSQVDGISSSGSFGNIMPSSINIINGISNDGLIGDVNYISTNIYNVNGFENVSINPSGASSITVTTDYIDSIAGISNINILSNPNIELGGINVDISGLQNTNNTGTVTPSSGMNASINGVSENNNIGIINIVKSLNKSIVGVSGNNNVSSPQINTQNNIIGLFNITDFGYIHVMDENIVSVNSLNNNNLFTIPLTNYVISLADVFNNSVIGNVGYILDYNANVIGYANVVSYGSIKAIKLELIEIDEVDLSYSESNMSCSIIEKHLTLSSMDNITDCLLIDIGECVLLLNEETITLTENKLTLTMSEELQLMNEAV